VCNGGNDILYGENNSRKAFLFRQTVTWVLFITVVLFFLLIYLPSPVRIFVLGTDELNYLVIFAIYFFFLALSEGLKRLLTAKQDFIFLNRLDIILSLFYFSILSFVLIYLKGYVMSVLILYSIQSIIFCLFCTWRLFTKYEANGRGYNKEAHLTKESFKIGSRSLIIGIATVLLFRSDILLLNHYSSTKTTGIYQVAVTFCTLLILLSTVLNRIITAKAVSEQGGGTRAFLVSKLFFLLGLLSYLPLLIFGRWVISLLFGNLYNDSFNVALILWGATIIWGAALPLSGYVVGKGRYPLAAGMYMILAAITNLILNLYLIPLYGASGAAFSSIIGYLVMLMGYFLEFKKIEKGRLSPIFKITKTERNMILKFLN
jgi:O-antigen/teichoic acid export membrane protein